MREISSLARDLLAKVTIYPGFFRTAPEIRLVSRASFFPDFVRFFIFLILFRLQYNILWNGDLLGSC
jgi:hypothetical protein